MKIGNLKTKEENGYVIFSREITYKCGEKKDDLWIKLKKDDADFFIDDRIDGYVCALLPTAMAFGEDIECDDPVSASLLMQFEKYLIPFLAHINPDLKQIQIKCKSIADYEQKSGYVATGMSRGLDSLSTVAYHTNQEKFSAFNIDCLVLFNSGFYLRGEKSTADYERYFAETQKVADELKMKLVLADSNIVSFSVHEFIPIHEYLTCGIALMIQKAFRTYYISSTYPVFNFRCSFHDPAYYETYLLQNLSTRGIRFYSGCNVHSRVEKMDLVAQRPDLIKHLYVCTQGGVTDNCGRCQKCIRTMLEADSLGKIDSLKDTFPIENFKKKRASFMAYMLPRRKKDILYKEIYDNYIANGYKIPFSAWLHAIYNRIFRERKIYIHSPIDPKD